MRGLIEPLLALKLITVHKQQHMGGGGGGEGMHKMKNLYI